MGTWSDPAKGREYQRKWRAANPEKVKRYRRTTYLNQKGRDPVEYNRKAAERHHDWVEGNRGRNKELQRESYSRNRDLRLKDKKGYAALYPEKIAANNKRQRAQRNKAYVGDKELQYQTAEYWTIVLGDPCSYCGEFTDTVDHIVPLAEGGSHTWDNLTAACRRCNGSKHTRKLLEFIHG